MNWTKVTDAMPEHGKDVLVCYTVHSSNKQVIVVGRYFERYKEEARTDEDNYEYREEDDSFYVVEGWYESQRNWDDNASIYIHEGHITHWAPLPDTPKEQAWPTSHQSACGTAVLINPLASESIAQ